MQNNYRNRQQQVPQTPNFVDQMTKFLSSIGFFSKVIIISCFLVFYLQYALVPKTSLVAMYFGFNYGAIVESQQYYRILTSTMSHQGIAHIFFNMCWMAIFGYTIEKRFGTLFFAVFNIWTMFLCNGMHMLYIYLRVYVLPVGLGGGAIELLSEFGIGYSAILFGILMLECISGEKFMPIMGFNFPKILIPFVYLGIS